MVINSKHTTLKLIPRGDNILACTKLNEAFFNIFNITINEHTSIIQPSVGQKDGNPIICVDLVINDIVYEQVKFIVVEAKNASPSIYVKQCDLKNGKPYKAPSTVDVFAEPPTPLIHESVPVAKKIVVMPQLKVDIDNLNLTSKEYIVEQIQTYADGVRKHLHKDLVEALTTSKEVFVREQLSIKNDLQKDNDKYIKQATTDLKGSLTKWAEDLQNSIIEQTTTSLNELQHETVQKLDSTLSSSSQTIYEQIKENTTNTLAGLAVEFKSSLAETLSRHLKTLTDHSNDAQSDLELYIKEQIEEIQDDVVDAQAGKFNQQIQQFTDAQDVWVKKYLTEKLNDNTTALETKSSSLILSAKDEIKSHTQSLYLDHFKSVEESIADILNEKSTNKSDILTEARKRGTNIIKNTLDEHNINIQKQLATIRAEFHNKISKFFEGVGGGSVAMQFADGGTMNGSLDVRGSILSGGRDLVDIFTGGGGSGYQTIQFNESSGLLTITPFGNTVSLSALSGGDTHSNSVQWNSVYTTVNASSATTWNYQGTDIKSLTADWQNTTNSFNIQSPNNASVYTTVNANSAAWGAVGGGSDVSTISANWESTYTTVNSNSADWNYQGTDIKALTANWESTYTTLNANSANWSNVYATVQSNSSTWIAQTLTYNETEAELTISNGNTISLSALNINSAGVYLPLSGGTLTGDLNIQANITSVSSIQFDTTYALNAGVIPGQIAWNSDESTLDLGLNADVTLQLGQETVIYVKNTSGEIIRNGWAVYASGASGTGSGHITISAYRANYGGVNDLYLIGVATQEISDNSFGFVTTIGKVRDVVKAEVQESTDLSTWGIGTILYVSTTERGKFTSVEPSAPNEILPIAMIIGENGTHRTFFVRSNHGYKLTELHDVKIVSPQNGDLLSWDNTNNFWYNTTAYQGTDIKALTANWDSTYTTVNSNSADWANHVDLSLIISTSANWDSTYTTVNTSSANWNYQGTDIKALSSNWQNTYTIVNSNSATWGIGGGVNGSLTYTRWQLSGSPPTSAFSIAGATSDTEEAYRVTVNAVIQDPATYTIDSTADTLTFSEAPPLSADIVIIETHTTILDITEIQSTSANWESTYTTVNTNSAMWTNDVYEEVWVGAGAMLSPTLSGAQSVTLPITGSGNATYIDAFNFDAAAIEYTQFSFLPPTNCNRATFKCQFSWTAASAGSASWNIQAISLNDSNSMDIAWGNAQEAIDYATGATTFQITSATNTISPSGSTNSNSLMLFRAYRNVNSVSDTLAVDASLLGVRLQYMMNGGLSASW